MAWGYTPRQLAGMLWFANRRRRHELADQIEALATASRGDPKAVNKTLKALRK